MLIKFVGKSYNWFLLFFFLFLFSFFSSFFSSILSTWLSCSPLPLPLSPLTHHFPLQLRQILLSCSFRCTFVVSNVLISSSSLSSLHYFLHFLYFSSFLLNIQKLSSNFVGICCLIYLREKSLVFQ